MSIRRTLMVAAMHARDLSRRRVALAILLLLPIVFYLSAELAPPDPATEQFLAENPDVPDPDAAWVLSTAGIGPLWSIATAALFVMLGSRRADQRLLLAGFRPTELLAGRVLTVLGLGAVITPLFTALIWAMREVEVGVLVGAIALYVVVAVGHGVLVAALVRDEMEGVLAIIGLTGIQTIIVGQAWLPLWGANELLQRAGGALDTTAAGTAVLHALAFGTGLLVVGVLAWARKVRLRAPAPLPTGTAGDSVADGRPARRAG